MINLDMTYCASPHCTGECGRQITPEVIEAHKRAEKLGIWQAYFCGEPEKQPTEGE